jgi:DNA-directed RNA polymerase subunit alpha
MLDIQKIFGKPKIIETKIDDKTSKFELMYVPRGFGHTLGNSLRRIILSYEVAWAVTGLKIKGVPYEYSVIDGVKESVIDIMLNFKKLRFKVDENLDKITLVQQTFKGVWKVFAKDLILPSWIELLNEDVYLFEITDPNVELVIDYRIEKWYWYYSLEFLRKREQNKDSEEIGLFLIDNDFKVVEYVRYDVEEIIDDFAGAVKDKLVLEVKSISPKLPPKDLVSFAWEVLASYARLFIFEDAYIDSSVLVDYSELEDTMVEETSKEKKEEVKVLPIDALPLSERTRNALIKNNILYVEDLEKKRKSELLSMKWIGRKAVDEIVQALANLWKSLAG